MKRNIALLFSVIGLFSCQKVIQLNLNTSPTQIVIQGNVYDQAGPDTVKITNSVRFDQSNVYPAVTGAKVTISTNLGESEVLTEITSGVYITSKLPGVPGRTYTLTVVTAGQTYTSISTMPYAVKIDSIYLKNSTFGKNKEATIKFQDPANVKNYYRVIEFVNNVKQNQFNVINDKVFEGKITNYVIRGAVDKDIALKTGDKVSVWLESLDPDAYEYFRTAITDSRESATPTNPVSNINNSALGYFNACSVRKITLVIP